MTGEMFDLLQKHSILADLLAGEIEPERHSATASGAGCEAPR